MKTDEKTAKRNEQDIIADVAESLEKIVKGVTEANSKLDHIIFLHRESRSAYAGIGNHDLDYQAYEE